jgi:ribonuclease HI
MTENTNSAIEIYTDGSCHTQLLKGGWAALIFYGNEKIILSGKEINTTHNRMELTAVINAIEHVLEKLQPVKEITVFSDSQYVIGLRSRKEKFTASDFTTKKGTEIRNADLVKKLLNFEKQISIHFTKVKAHQKKNDTLNHNIEADLLCRKIVREAVKAES